MLEALAETYRAADGFVVVSGEYNHGIPPALKNLLDHFLEEYFFRPSAIVSYSAGAFGGVRAAMQLRMTWLNSACRASPRSSLFLMCKTPSTTMAAPSSRLLSSVSAGSSTNSNGTPKRCAAGTRPGRLTEQRGVVEAIRAAWRVAG